MTGNTGLNKDLDSVAEVTNVANIDGPSTHRTLNVTTTSTLTALSDIDVKTVIEFSVPISSAVSSLITSASDSVGRRIDPGESVAYPTTNANLWRVQRIGSTNGTLQVVIC